MAILDLTNEHAGYHKGRILMLGPQSERRWGAMNVERMMRHLRAVIEVSLGDLDGKIKVIVPPLVGRAIGWQFFDVITTWPRARKGTPNPIPQIFPLPELSFERERQALLDAVDRFTGQCQSMPEELRLHPILGMIPLRRWARVHGVHMNHHYRQYGLV